MINLSANILKKTKWQKYKLKNQILNLFFAETSIITYI